MLHVLIPDTTDSASSQVAGELVARGHQVHTCRTRDGRVACAVLGELPCPLDATRIDVAVAAGASAGMAGVGDGALCAVRHRIPLVLTGNHIDHPLLPWATAAVVISDATDLVEEIAAEPLVDHSHLAHRALVDQLGRRGLATDGARAEVRRTDGTLRVDLWPGGPVSSWAAGVVADHVLQRLRAFDRWARIMDVMVHRVPEEAAAVHA